MKNELDYIGECLRLIGDKFLWGDISGWTNHNYEVLSEEIRISTGISISSRTIRRLTNKKIKSNPQTATKNALAKYIGFESWEHFVMSKNKNSSIQLNKPSKINAFILQYFWVVMFVILIGLSSFFILFYPSIEITLNKSKVVFQSNDMTGHAPHTASFFYDVSKIRSSNIFIDNNFYDEGEMIPIKKNMHFYNKTFELPDYYAVKIIANGERLSCVGVHVMTEGWETIVNEKLFKNINNVNDLGQLHLDNKTLEGLKINSDSALEIEYRNIKNFGVMGDEMTFETRFMNNDKTGGRGCYESKIEIINTHGRLSFNFIMPGCDEKLLKAEFGDVYLAGEFNNLNTFFQDVSYWRNLKIKTQKKNVGVFLDDVQIYSIHYNDPLDEIKGITFSFNGSGAVDFVKIYNENDDLVYRDEFLKNYENQKNY